MYRLSDMWLAVGVCAGLVLATMCMCVTGTESASDDNWKRDLYTNRTLRLDQDPLHVAYASRRRDALATKAAGNCTDDNYMADTIHTCEVVNNPCCQDVYDCELCQLLKGYKTVDAIELLSEIIKILEMQDDLLSSTCSDLSENIETSCVITPHTWKL